MRGIYRTFWLGYRNGQWHQATDILMTRPLERVEATDQQGVDPLQLIGPSQCVYQLAVMVLGVAIPIVDRPDAAQDRHLIEQQAVV